MSTMTSCRPRQAVGPILYYFRDKARYWSKIVIFFKAHLLPTPIRGARWNTVLTVGTVKLEWWVYKTVKNVSIQYKNVTDK